VPYPYTPGWEGSGVIEAVGTDVAEKFAHLLGKRVGFFKQKEPTYTIGGSFAEYAVTDITSIIPLRDETTLEQGVALFVNPLSALCLIDRVKVLKSDCVIITAAASQLGRMLIKLAAKEGIKTINIVRRPEQAEFLRNELKAEYVVDSSAPDYKERLTELSQTLKPTTALECISGNTVGEILGYLGFNSTLILYGLLSEQPAGGINPLRFLGFNQTIESFMLP
jgi:NADPH:quinone reductase